MRLDVSQGPRDACVKPVVCGRGEADRGEKGSMQEQIDNVSRGMKTMRV